MRLALNSPVHKPFLATIALLASVAAWPPETFAQTPAPGDLVETLYEQMSSLVFVSSFHPETLDRAPAIVTVIHGPLIEAMGARTLVDILRILPGIDIRRLPTGELRPSIHALDQPADVLLLIDGERMNNPRTGVALFDLPASLIDKVEVIRGPASSLYGSNALLGVISVTTKKLDRLTTALRVGTDGTVEGNWITLQRFDRWTFNTFFDYRRSDGPDFTIPGDNLTFWQPEASLTPGPAAGDFERVHAGLVIHNAPVEVGTFFLQEERGAYVGPKLTLSPGTRYESWFLGVWARTELKLAEAMRMRVQLLANQWKIRDEEVLFRV